MSQDADTPSAISARSGASPPAREIRAQQLYHEDGWTWSVEQAEALRRRDYEAIDWTNVIEEIESVGRWEKSRWTSKCIHALEHLLAIEHWADATNSTLAHWTRRVINSRIRMARQISENPGLKSQYREMLDLAWRSGRPFAVMRLAKYDARKVKAKRARRTLKREWDERLPKSCPYRLEDVTAFDPRIHQTPDDDIWPPSVARVLNLRLDAGYPLRTTPSTGTDRPR